MKVWCPGAGLALLRAALHAGLSRGRPLTPPHRECQAGGTGDGQAQAAAAPQTDRIWQEHAGLPELYQSSAQVGLCMQNVLSVLQNGLKRVELYHRHRRRVLHNKVALDPQTPDVHQVHIVFAHYPLHWIQYCSRADGGAHAFAGVQQARL